jgi:hypothetical protein
MTLRVTVPGRLRGGNGDGDAVPQPSLAEHLMQTMSPLAALSTGLEAVSLIVEAVGLDSLRLSSYDRLDVAVRSVGDALTELAEQMPERPALVAQLVVSINEAARSAQFGDMWEAVHELGCTDMNWSESFVVTAPECLEPALECLYSDRGQLDFLHVFTAVFATRVDRAVAFALTVLRLESGEATADLQSAVN